MKNKQKKICSVCLKEFLLHDLYPNVLIRDSLFETIQHKYPDFTREGFICYQDLRYCNALHYENLLKEEKGQLTSLEHEVIESLKQHEFITENTNKQFEQKLTFGERISDHMAQFGGSWAFIIAFIVVLVVWIIINSLQYLSEKFDPYPFILLNLVLSTLAAIQAPIILMSQNRQAAKDRIQVDQDYMVNLKAEMQIRQLHSRFDVFMKQHWQMMSELHTTQDELLAQLERRNEITKK